MIADKRSNIRAYQCKKDIIYTRKIYIREHTGTKIQHTRAKIQHTKAKIQHTSRCSYRDIKGIMHKCKGARRRDECARGGHERKNRMYEEKVQYERKPAIWTRVKAYDSKN